MSPGPKITSRSAGSGLSMGDLLMLLRGRNRVAVRTGDTGGRLDVDGRVFGAA